eukprot:3557516-Rhodomonas_salina.2
MQPAEQWMGTAMKLAKLCPSMRLEEVEKISEVAVPHSFHSFLSRSRPVARCPDGVVSACEECGVCCYAVTKDAD